MLKAFRTTILLTAAFLATLMVTRVAYAQELVPQSTYPVSNALNITTTTTISAAFSHNISATTVTSHSFAVRGLQGGLVTGMCGVINGDTIIVTPTNAFHAGEVVMVNASSQIESSGGITLTPYAWQFTIDARHGDGDGGHWAEQVVDANFDGATSVYAADVDGDGDLDVLGADNPADDIAWWENTNGDGTAWSEHTVDADFDGAQSVYAADVDGDGDLDVLGAAITADDIAWWENTNGDGTAWSKHSLDANFDGAASVYAADVDSDGDLDVLGAAHWDDIAWWENTNGDGTAWSEHSVDTDFGAASVYAADVDGDGDLDVLGAAYYADGIAWWENVDQTGPGTGDGTAWSEHSVDADFDGARSVYAADVDGDGDLDVLGAAYFADDIAWWENTNGDGTAWSERSVDADFDGAYSVYAADVDGDGDLDVLGAAWYADDITIWLNEPPADLVLSKSCMPRIALPGDAITYTLSFANAGSATASGVVITDSIPVSVTHSSLSYTYSGAPITATGSISYVWEVQDLAPGDGGVITITGVLSQDLSAGPFINTATIATATTEVVTTNNSSAVSVTVQNVAPVLDAIGNQSVDEETELVFTATANDANSDTLSYSLFSAPSEASIGSSSGVFSWTPTEVQGPGDYQVTIISDTIITDSETITITVNEVNLAPVLAPIGNQSVDEETELAFTASATDADIPTQTLNYSLLGAPTGASINSSSGTFSWTPTEMQGPGNYQVTIIVSDTIIIDSETITITVNEVNLAPVLNPIGSKSVDEETELTFIATATDADAPTQTLTYSLVGAPTGALINISSGAFSWTPTEVQGPDDYQVTIIVSDTIITDSETITITVSEVNTAPTVSDIPDQSTDAGVAVGPTPFTVNDADIPTNTLTLYKASSNTDLVTTTHIVFGGSGAYRTVTITPTLGVTGTARITITVSDGDLTAYDVFTLSVTANNPPQFVGSPVETATVGVPYTCAVSATDADAGDTLTFTAPISDTWLTLTQLTTRTVSLTGTPLIAGEVPVVLQVTDGEDSATQAFTITVSSANQPPVADAGKNQTVVINATVTLDGSGSADPDGGGLIYGWAQTGGTSVVTLSDSAAVSPTFTAPGTPTTLTFALVVTDSLGLPDPTPDEVVVTVTNQPPVANAGPDQSVDTNALVTLDGSGSSDPDGDLPLSYLWTQAGGPNVILSSAAISQPTFSAPDALTILTFTLSVTDAHGLAAPSLAEVVVTVTQPYVHVYLPLLVRNFSPPITFPARITDAIPARPVAYPGEVFYVELLQVPSQLPPGGHFYFSSQQDAIAPVMVDDALVILLDGTEVFTHAFSTSSEPPEPDIVEVEQGTMEQLAGRMVTIEFRDVYGVIVEASEMWLIWMP